MISCTKLCTFLFLKDIVQKRIDSECAFYEQYDVNVIPKDQFYQRSHLFQLCLSVVYRKKSPLTTVTRKLSERSELPSTGKLLVST